MNDHWQPTCWLRFIARDGRRILQQQWHMWAASVDDNARPLDQRFEWRDIVYQPTAERFDAMRARAARGEDFTACGAKELLDEIATLTKQIEDGWTHPDDIRREMEKLTKERDEALCLAKVRGKGCQCSDDEACGFVRENRALRAALSKALTYLEGGMEMMARMEIAKALGNP